MLIAQRLRLALNVELAVLCERERIDMSREAITHRIRDLADMSTLCLALGHPPIVTDSTIELPAATRPPHEGSRGRSP